MKLFVVFSVIAFCACANATFNHPFLKNHRLFGGQKSEPAPVETPSSGGGLAGLASLGKLLAIPLSLKKTLIQSHQKRINKHFDHVIGTLNKFGGSFGGGSTSSNVDTSVGTSFGPDSGTTYVAPESGTTYVAPESGPSFVPESTYVAETDNSASAGGLSGSFGGGNVGGSVDYNALGGGSEISSGLASTGYQGGSAYQGGSSYSAGSASGNVGAIGAPGSVHTYQPQPAPNTQYSSNPVVLHLYAVENGAQGHAVSDCNTAPIAPAPIAPQQTYAPAPQQTYAPAPQQTYAPIASQQTYETQPIPIAPQQTFESIDFETPVSPSFSNVEVQQQTMQEIKPTNTYLPPFRRY